MPAEDAAGSRLPGGPARDAARSVFSKFRALLDANTAALATMAALERMRGGEYIFDRAFLEQSARQVADLTHQAVYAVNAMSGNRYVALYDRFMAIAASVEDILAGRPGADDDRPLRPLSRLRLEDRAKVGPDAAALGELSGQLGLPVPRGFALAAGAWADGTLTAEAGQALAQVLADPACLGQAAGVAVAVAGERTDGTAVRRQASGLPPRAEAVRDALSNLARDVRSEGAGDSGLFAMVAAAGPAGLRGRMRTFAPEADGRGFLRLELWPEGDPATRDTLFLDRSHPFAPRRGVFSPKPMDKKLPDGQTPLDAGPNGFLRGSALLPFEAAAGLAGQGLAAERLLGAPLELAFAGDASGGVVFTAAHLLAVVSPDDAAPAGPDAPGEPLLSGGEAACLGLASGKVVAVDETTDAADFPYGAVAVTRSASPVLAPLLRRAGAVVAEVGDAAGHLAAVAREYRVPALFGLAGALAALPPGLVVTVDAGAGAVFRGPAASRPTPDAGLAPDDPEYLTLRRLLRRIAALTLTDPDSPDFTPAGCRTLHDILHFAHDRAVAVLTDLRQAGVSERPATPLALPVPLDLKVLDIGGGLVPGAAGLASVRSRPLAALLSGLTAPGMWDTTPARVGLGDILGAMGKALPAGGGNLAIAARSYCNVSLRLGYHFTVVDAYLGQNPEKNTIYFRFVGGMAGPAGREARAAFLQRILSRYDFKVEVSGDLVVARLKFIEPETGGEALRLVGRLCAFARQRDTGLTGPADAAALEQAFFEASGLTATAGPGGLAPEAGQ
uniref:Phosphoenolpyruvate synthase/pyruvate phosphate dikinase n=1 Tax=Desulfovibrio sp. U5L TaxID=596152 RepID=I2PYK5_9BACT